MIDRHVAKREDEEADESSSIAGGSLWSDDDGENNNNNNNLSTLTGNKNNKDHFPVKDTTMDESATAVLGRKLVRNETNAVRCLRLSILSVLFVAALLVSIAVYLFTKKSQEDTFEESFYDLSSRLAEGFHGNAKLRVQVMDMFTTSLTSTAVATAQVWPFVTINDYDARATAARSILGSRYLAIYPIVSKDLRRPWEQYTQRPNVLSWLNESFDFQDEFLLQHNRNHSIPSLSGQRQLQQLDDNEGEQELLDDQQVVEEEEEDSDEPYNNTALNDGLYQTNRFIYRKGDPDNNPNDMGAWVDEDADAPGPFFPMWQISPTTQAEIYSINYNVMDPYYPESYIGGVAAVAETDEVVFGGVWNVDDETGIIVEDDDYNDREVPVMSLFYPVFDKIMGDDKELVAIADLNLEFGPFFTSVLPPNSNSITCVVSNCNQVFSFAVTGESATYLGPEDLHDPQYDELVRSTRMTDFDLSNGGTLYNGPPINDNNCPWQLKVYPTKELEDEFVTSAPVFYMAVVLGVFFCTCLTFVLYDWIVEKRQRKVMKTAAKTDKIVTSLFPEGFRPDDNSESHKGKKEPKKIHSFKTSDHVEAMSTQEVRVTSSLVITSSQQKMAKKYPNCTVFFADIAGFTSWSSSRSAEQVFTLLETLYGAFDKLAERHSVFKIETIGDCYVAVTGLPEAQPNHALLMVKFSRDIQAKMSNVTQSLETILGADTRDLAMRVGLHSGSVTAGVLRGQKARFQLFGDTVNTAARMESNGQKHCIHASQETADILIAMGKEHWVHARQEKIHAKGKGELQTYWIRPTSKGSVASQSSGNQSSMTSARTSDAAFPGDQSDKQKQSEYDAQIEV